MSRSLILTLSFVVLCAHSCVAGPADCGPNAHKVPCGSFCEPSCDLPETTLCGINPAFCTLQCRCLDGYVRDSRTDRCILYENCFGNR